MIPVLYEDNHLLCVEKPVNIPVQSDSSGDTDLLTMLKSWLKERDHKPGNVYLGLVHRLDRPVGGVMVFAKTSKAASRLSEAVRTNRMRKEYYAVLDGIPKVPEDRLEDYLQKNTKTNTVTVTDKDHGKYCALQYETIAAKNGRSLVKILLETGRSHQIRVQFASRSLPLVFDQRYHPHPEKGQIALYACSLSFPHPISGETITITHQPPAKKPWIEFEEYYADH